MPSQSPIVRMEHILEAVGDIESFIAGKSYQEFLGSLLLRRAVERSVEIISEASRYIPDAMKERHTEIPWRKVAAVGNVLRHGYEGVDEREIWRIVQRDLPRLKAVIEEMYGETRAFLD